MFHTRIPYLTDEQEMAIKSEMLDSLFFDKYFKTNLKFRSIEEELLKVLNIVFKWYENAICGDNTFLEINGCNEPAYIILLKYYILKKLIYVSIDEVIIKKNNFESIVLGIIIFYFFILRINRVLVLQKWKEMKI